MEELKQELEEKFVEEANIKETGELFRFIEYNSDFIQWLITKISQVEPEVIAKTADTKPIEWITAQYELASDRYMFNEKFILELHTSFWKRLFVKYYTRKHLKEILSSFSV
ncbi:MAG: hypothetical protein JETCAE03_35230 [Ignavibacteriaceae bacterium]|nr:MAG: hypothetical protein JETCAE03_35230 [Ignavibacteriaceae bacterium]